MVGPDTICVRSDKVLGVSLDSETVLMSIASGQYYSLTATSRVIWDHLKAPMRVGDLCAALAGTYQMPLEAVQADTLKFLDYLEAQKLIESRSGLE